MPLDKNLESYDLAHKIAPWLKTIEQVRKTPQQIAKEAEVARSEAVTKATKDAQAALAAKDASAADVVRVVLATLDAQSAQPIKPAPGNTLPMVVSGKLIPGAFEVVAARNKASQDFHLISYKKKFYSHLIEKNRVIEIGYPIKDFKDYVGVNKKHAAHAKDSWYMKADSETFFEDLANSLEAFQARNGIV